MLLDLQLKDEDGSLYEFRDNNYNKV
jgi:hypothetical protein